MTHFKAVLLRDHLIKIGEKGALTPHRLDLPKYHPFVRSHVFFVLASFTQCEKQNKQATKKQNDDRPNGLKSLNTHKVPLMLHSSH